MPKTKIVCECLQDPDQRTQRRYFLSFLLGLCLFALILEPAHSGPAHHDSPTQGPGRIAHGGDEPGPANLAVANDGSVDHGSSRTGQSNRLPGFVRSPAFLAIAAVAMLLLIARLANQPIRYLGYRFAKTREKIALDIDVDLPEPSETLLSEEKEKRASFVALHKEHHEAAIAAQNRYHTRLAQVCSLLLAALIVICLGIAAHHESYFAYFAAYFDLFALCGAVVLYVLARTDLKALLRHRTAAEAVRQMSYLSALVQNPDPAEFDADELLHDFRTPDKNVDVVIEKWTQLWSRIDCGSLRLSTSMTQEMLTAYLNKRVLRQYKWFNGANLRLTAANDRRERIVLALFSITVAAAAIKVLGALGLIAVNKSAVSFVIVIAVAVTAALAAYHLGNNGRALRHIYQRHAQRVRKWLENFPGLSELGHAPENTPVGADRLLLLLAFERMLFEEHKDWVEVTRHDAIELG